MITTKRTEKILLLGGSGMLGTAISKYCSLEHRDVLYDLIAPSSSQCNLMKEGAVKTWIEMAKPDIVINCAAKVGGIEANINSQYEFMSSNLKMGTNFVSDLEDLQVQTLPKIIYIGSSCMYPRNFTQPLKEEYLGMGSLEPTNFGYGMAKLTTSNLLTLSGKGKTLIAPNMFGPNDNFNPNTSHLIPSVIKKVSEAAKFQGTNSGKLRLEIWGSGEAKREFMHVVDFVEGLFFCINNWNKIPSVINVGLGYDYSIEEYYRMIASVYGYHQIEFIHDMRRPEGMKQKLLDVSNIHKLGFHEKYTPYTRIVETVKWFEEENKNK